MSAIGGVCRAMVRSDWLRAGNVLEVREKQAYAPPCLPGSGIWTGMERAGYDITRRRLKMLEREYGYYLDHQEELIAKYLGKVIVIAEDSVDGVFESSQNAYTETIKTRPLGTFLIQEIVDDPAKLVKRFYSRVYA